jgi:hypothetical protein
MVDEALHNMSSQFETMYAKRGRPSIPPEKLDYDLLFRWVVGLNIDDSVWDLTVFTKNRKRLLGADVAQSFFAEIVAQASSRGLLSTEHFTVDGTSLKPGPVTKLQTQRPR